MRPFALLSMLLCLLLAGCTGDFRSINDDRAGIDDDDLAADHNGLGYRLGIVQQGIYFNYDYGKGRNWPFQIIQNLNADLFAGYMHDPKPLLGGSNNSDYNLQDGWNGSMWQFTYSYVLPEIHRVERAEERMPPFAGVAKILKVMAMQRVSDYYGPIVYTRFGDASHDFRPDSQQEAYEAFFADLDRAAELLDGWIAAHPDAREFARFDLLLDGSYPSWLRLANSLRMRLAVRIATADPERARSEFCKALAHEAGVIETCDAQAAVAITDTYTNPLGVINHSWKEAVMNASAESILKGLSDPRLATYFEPCVADIEVADDAGGIATVAVAGEYHGIRQGTCFSHAYYGGYSRLRVDPSTRPVLFSAAEAWFLRSEAALRGWTREDAGDCYRRGVESSFAQHGLSDAGEYLAGEDTGADYADPLDAANDIAARSRIAPRWDASADREKQLERILTQKWIALFPEGCEAWAEQRRTGYPRLFPVRYNHSKGSSISTEEMIRRLPFPATLATSDPRLYEALSELLGGDDHGGTRLWWDTGRNF